jgi:hypothetical protein
VQLTLTERTRQFEDHYGYATIRQRADHGRSYEIDLQLVPDSTVYWKLLFLIDHPTGEPITVEVTVQDTGCAVTATIPVDQLPPTDALPSDPARNDLLPLASAAIAGTLTWLGHGRRRQAASGGRLGRRDDAPLTPTVRPRG